MTSQQVGKYLKSRQGELMSGLSSQGFTHEQAESFVHALVDILESVGKIYDTMLPELLDTMDQPSEVFKDKLWDIREEFRHIDYHLRDANLTDL